MQIVVRLSLGRRDIAHGFQLLVVVEPSHPFLSGELDHLPGLSGRPAVDQFGLYAPVDGLSQGVVVAVTATATVGSTAASSTLSPPPSRVPRFETVAA